MVVMVLLEDTSDSIAWGDVSLFDDSGVLRTYGGMGGRGLEVALFPGKWPSPNPPSATSMASASCGSVQLAFGVDGVRDDILNSVMLTYSEVGLSQWWRACAGLSPALRDDTAPVPDGDAPIIRGLLELPLSVDVWNPPSLTPTECHTIWSNRYALCDTLWLFPVVLKAAPCCGGASSLEISSFICHYLNRLPSPLPIPILLQLLDGSQPHPMVRETISVPLVVRGYDGVCPFCVGSDDGCARAVPAFVAVPVAVHSQLVVRVCLGILAGLRVVSAPVVSCVCGSLILWPSAHVATAMSLPHPGAE
jgi:hypothetical protein